MQEFLHDIQRRVPHWWAVGVVFVASILVMGCSTSDKPNSKAASFETSIVKELPNGLFQFSIPKEGITLRRLLNEFTRYTGKSVTTLEKNDPKIIRMISSLEVAREDLMSFFQVLLYAHDMYLSLIERDGIEILLVEGIKTSQICR